MSPLTEPTRLTLAKTYVGIDDPDAANYIALVEAADTAAGSPGGLETATKVAIHSFVKGCKADGIWPAIKASCILAGARTLAGALVSLAGTPPTKFGTEGNWNYNRKDGLQGDGSTNYLNSNRLASADPLNNFHMSVFVDTAAPTGTVQMYIGGQTSGSASNDIYRNSTDLNLRSRAGSYIFGGSGGNTGFIGHSRNSPSSFIVRSSGGQASAPTASVAADAQDIYVFARNVSGSFNLPTTARLAFYSIGESLDLAKLDTRVTDLINAFGAAIP